MCVIFFFLSAVQPSASEEEEDGGVTEGSVKRAKKKFVDDSNREELPTVEISPLEMDAPQKHFYGLAVGCADIGSLLESRRLLADFSEAFPTAIKEGYKDEISAIKKMTERVREQIAPPKSLYGPDSTNLLSCSIYLNDSLVNLRKVVFVSGWPTSYKRNKIREALGDATETYYLSSLVSTFDDRYDYRNLETSVGICREFLEKLRGISPEESSVSYLHEKRITHSRGYVKRTLEEPDKKTLISRIQQNTLHTERALLFYLSQDEVVAKILEILPERTEDIINIYLNIASSRSVCLLCADHLFGEGEWGKAFVEKLHSRKPEYTFKLIVVVSSYEEHKDRVDGDFKKYLQTLRTGEKKVLGFDGNFINLMGMPPTTPDLTKPHIHHIKIPIEVQLISEEKK